MGLCCNDRAKKVSSQFFRTATLHAMQSTWSPTSPSGLFRANMPNKIIKSVKYFRRNPLTYYYKSKIFTHDFSGNESKNINSKLKAMEFIPADGFGVDFGEKRGPVSIHINVADCHDPCPCWMKLLWSLAFWWRRRKRLAPVTEWKNKEEEDSNSSCRRRTRRRERRRRYRRMEQKL